MTENATATQEAPEKTRAQSTIVFPYGDLEDAIQIARGIMERGGVPLEVDQLAAALNQTPKSGSFRTKIATAKIFGLIKTISNRYELTDLGFAIMDKGRERAAKADAFLTVPLYRRIYDEFRNRQLPPRPVALERTMVQFGVAETQADRARQAFDRSGKQAGFFDSGNDRLIRPSVGSTGAAAPMAPIPEGHDPPDFGNGDAPDSDTGAGMTGGGGGGGGRKGLHPFIQGLLQTLPEPGTVWTIEGRAAWLQAAAQNFKLIYKGDGQIDVKAVNGGS